MMNVMKRAWEIARAAEQESGFRAIEFIAEALRLAWEEAKAEEMTDEEKIEALEAKGFKRWTKYGKDRLYIDVKKLMNINIQRRRTGSIADSEMNGETISHRQASRLLSSKIWIDINDNFSKHVDAWDWEYEETITQALDRLVEGIA